MYQAVVARLKNVRKLPTADFLQIATCQGYSVIVGLESKEDDLVILFADDGQLSHEYCWNNNLYNKPELNNDPDAKCGFFSHKRRVMCQTFRKAKSEAYVASLNSVAFTGFDINSLVEGFTFTHLNNIEICRKYVTEATLNKGASNKEKTPSGYNKAIMKQIFKEHIDTAQWRFALDNDLKGLVHITLKYEGTSGRSCYLYVPEEIPLKWYHKGWNKFVEVFYKYPKLNDKDEAFFNSLAFFKPEYIYKWKSLFASRRVIKGEVRDDFAHDYREKAHLMLKPYIKQGETWFYEIVGYNKVGDPIQGSAATDKMDKKFQKKFNNPIVYSYNCKVNEFKVFVYRITVQNQDGDFYELPWSEVKSRVEKAGLESIYEYGTFLVQTDEEIQKLKDLISKIIDEYPIEDPVDNSHPREGVVVRIEQNGKTLWKKEKTFEYKVLANIIKDNDNHIDEEESCGEFELTEAEIGS